MSRRACLSLHRTSAVTRRARWRFVYDALVKQLSPGLFCPHNRQRTLVGLVGLSGGWFADSVQARFKKHRSRL